MQKICLDVDGVIADFGKGLENLNIDYVSNKQKFWHLPYHISLQKLSSNTDFWLSLPRLVEASELQFEITAYISARRFSVEVTEEWIQINNLPPAPVYHDSDKVEVLKAVKCDLYVDDNYQTFVECNRAGILTLLHDQPWNRRYNVGFYRINSVKEVCYV